jgi:hypothetical protein
MKTASHFTFFGAGRISISLGSPRGLPAGYRIFKVLAPKREWMNAPRELYIPRFRAEVLAPLDPQQVWDKLHELANGAEPVLQCFEKPPFTVENFCHRRLVAEWFGDRLGHEVLELEPQSRPKAEPKPEPQPSLI